MEEQKPIYTGTLEDLERIDIDSYITEARSQICSYYANGFLKARKAAEDAKDEVIQSAFELLYLLVSFAPDYTDPAKPYRPKCTLGDKRSMLPEDIADSDYAAIRIILKRTEDPSLKARLLDLLWLKEKNHADCRDASEYYITSAKRLDATNNEFSFLDASKEFHRGLQLARLLGLNSNAYKNAENALIEAIFQRVESDSTLRTCDYLEVARQLRTGEAAKLAQAATEIAQRLKQNNEFDWSLRYFELAAEFWHFARQLEQHQKAQIEVGECYVSKASSSVSTGRGYLIAATSLKNGIEALRRARAEKIRIAELRSLLIEYQEKSLDEMTPIEHSYDISQEVEKCREFVAGLPFDKALLKYVAVIPLIDLTKLQEIVEKNIRDYPLQHLSGGSFVDQKGRSRFEKKSILNLTGNEAEKALEGEMMSHFIKFHMPHVTSCFVQPAREQIVFDHQPDIYDLIFLVRNNPFVPEHHEGIYLRGLHAGFHGDFLLSSALLVPQIENSIRHVLESMGVETSNLMDDGTQPYKLLGPLFDMPETQKILTPQLCFELRALLIEKSGAEFRNRLAHGFVTEGECYDKTAVYL